MLGVLMAMGEWLLGHFQNYADVEKDGMSSDKNVWENPEEDKMVGNRHITRTVNNSTTICI